MKKLLILGLSAVILVLPAPARAWECGPYKIDGGVNIYFNIQTTPATLPLAPWYLYFPVEARNLPVGPTDFYPNWPQQHVPGAVGPSLTPPAPQVVPPPAPVPTPPIQQTGYYTYGSPNARAPAYWYAR
jgi:hypothetical protein